MNLENLERGSEIVMQAQYAPRNKLASIPNETLEQARCGAMPRMFKRAHCRAHASSQAMSKSNPKRDLLWQNLGASLQHAFPKRPPSPGGVAGLGVDAASDF
jgi:hypothetical protein